MATDKADDKTNSFADDDGIEVEVDFIDGDDDGDADAPAKPTAAKPVAAADADGDAGPDEMTNLRAELARERTARVKAESDRDSGDIQSRARVAAAEAQQASVQRDSARGMVDAVDVKIKAAIETKKIARREANTDLEIEAEEALSKLRGIKHRLETEVLPNIADPEQLAARAREAANARPTPRQQGTPVNAHVAARNGLAQQWAQANPWMGDAGHSQAVGFMSSQIHKEGINPDDPAHFAELTKRLSVAFPKLGVKGIGTSTPRQGGGPPVAGGRTSASRTSNPNKIRLTSQDAVTMRKYKLDPKDKKAQRHYAMALREIEREESGRNIK